jgi:hypothetical protein
LVYRLSYGLKGLDFESHQEQEIFFFTKTSKQHLGSFPGVKQLGCEANNTPASSAEVKNEWSYNSGPPICLLGEGNS